MFSQGGFVNLLPIRGVVLPATEDDTLPFVGQGPHCRVVRTALGALLEVVGGRPTTLQDACLGVLVKTLLVKGGAEIAPMNPARATTLLSHRRDAGVALQIGVGAEAFALAA